MTKINTPDLGKIKIAELDDISDDAFRSLEDPTEEKCRICKTDLVIGMLIVIVKSKTKVLAKLCSDKCFKEYQMMLSMIMAL